MGVLGLKLVVRVERLHLLVELVVLVCEENHLQKYGVVDESMFPLFHDDDHHIDCD